MIRSWRFSFGCLVWLLGCIVAVGCSAAAKPTALDSRLGHTHPPPVVPGGAAVTLTPFRPLQPTQPGLAVFSPEPARPPDLSQPPAATPAGGYLAPPTAQPAFIPVYPGAGAALPRSKVESSATGSLEPVLDYHGIDLDSHQRVEITIDPPSREVNRGKPIKISFLPGERCKFGDHKGCVYAYKPSLAGNVIIVTIHSGVGGEGQRLRSALEGTGINRAGLSLKQVQVNLLALAGAEVTIRQGEHVVHGLQLGGLARIPARALKRYFRADLSEILGVAADTNDAFIPWVNTSEPVLVLETCGWKMSGEPGSEQVSDTTGSVYLSLIH